MQKYPPLFNGFCDLPIYEKGKIGWESQKSNLLAVSSSGSQNFEKGANSEALQTNLSFAECLAATLSQPGMDAPPLVEDATISILSSTEVSVKVPNPEDPVSPQSSAAATPSSPMAAMDTGTFSQPLPRVPKRHAMKTRPASEVPSKRPRTDNEDFDKIARLLEKVVNSYSASAFDLPPEIIPEDDPLRTVYSNNPNSSRGKIRSLNIFLYIIP